MKTVIGVCTAATSSALRFDHFPPKNNQRDAHRVERFRALRSLLQLKRFSNRKLELAARRGNVEQQSELLMLVLEHRTKQREKEKKNFMAKWN
jgi:hypothetical protein